MIVVKVELWPYGLEEEAEVVAEARIVNSSRHSLENRYAAQITERATPELGIASMDRMVHIGSHDRRQSVWALIRRVLEKAVAGPA